VIASLGEMLVVMIGGIDLSIPGVMTLIGLMMVGLPAGDDGKLAQAIAESLGFAAPIGLCSGALVAVFGLNSLIVTLAVGQIALGVADWHKDTTVKVGAGKSSVPPALSSWPSSRPSA
jgi:ribose transport system permease protein